MLLLALISPVLVLTLIFCRAGRLNWLLEMAPALIGYVALAATYRRLRLSDFCYEFIEWESTYVFAADVGQAFLGSQGDPWDAQWDMLLGLIGGAVGFVALAPLHDRSSELALARARVVAPS